MRLDDINAFLDSFKLTDRLHQRAFGDHMPNLEVQLPSASALREAATICDRPIGMVKYDDGIGKRMSFEYRGVVFEHWGRCEEVD